MTVPISSCTTTILIWVDTNALQNGQTKGVYLVDNRLNWGSTSEGTPNLSTHVTNGTNICWQVLNVDKNSPVQLDIQAIGNASVWGASGQPQQIDNITWTGQVQATGSTNYQITFNAVAPGQSGISTTVSSQMVVQ